LTTVRDQAQDHSTLPNITVNVDDEVHRRARIRAAALGTSLTAVVRRYLRESAGGETDFARRKRLQDETLASVRAFRAGDRLHREAIHDRSALR
jgi:plasmid stability protein